MALNFEPHTKPEKIVAGVWMVTQVFSFGFVVSAWCFASDVRKYSESFVVGTDAGPSVAFDVVWTSLMVLAASVFSGFVLPLWTRKYTNAMSFGALMGVVATMASVMLMTAVRYGQPSSAHKGVSHWSSANATAAFAALLFLSQIALIAFAAMYRHSVLKEVPNYAGAEQTTPHAQPQPVTTAFPLSATRAPAASAPPTPGSGGSGASTSAVVGSKLGSLGRNPFSLFATEHAAAEPPAAAYPGAQGADAPEPGAATPTQSSPSVGAAALLAAHFASPSTPSSAAVAASHAQPHALAAAGAAAPSGAAVTTSAPGSAPVPPGPSANTTFATPMTSAATRAIQPPEMPLPSAPVALPSAASAPELPGVPTASLAVAPPHPQSVQPSSAASLGPHRSASAESALHIPPSPSPADASPFESVSLR